MKKLFNTTINCIIVCVLLSSCSSNISITKRHYTKGYYIEYSKQVQTTNPEKEELKIVQNKKMSAVHPVQYLSKGAIIGKKTDQEVDKINHLSIVPANLKMIPKANSELISSPISAKNISITKSPISQNNQVLFDVSGHYGNEGGEGAALSLLWIIIIVVLILWLIGILAGGFGLGGLINLLLVIALILLILWLLRIL